LFPKYYYKEISKWINYEKSFGDMYAKT